MPEIESDKEFIERMRHELTLPVQSQFIRDDLYKLLEIWDSRERRLVDISLIADVMAGVPPGAVMAYYNSLTLSDGRRIQGIPTMFNDLRSHANDIRRILQELEINFDFLKENRERQND